MVVITEEDEDFLWAIDELSEDKKNLIIGYILSVARAAYEKGRNEGGQRESACRL